MLRTTEAIVALVFLLGLAVPVLAQPAPVLAQPLETGLSNAGLAIELRPSTKASPPLPPMSTFPIQLVLDDDSAEGAFGFLAGGARQLLWFNRFVNPGPFALEEIWVLFPSGADIPLGGNVQLVVFLDPDGDPSNGADLLATYDETIQAADGDTFSVYTLTPALEVPGGGDVLIGAVNRYFTTGVDPSPTLPAAFDSTASQGLSYFALWTGDPPNPPDLATASTVDVLTGAVSGNFMIRGFGTLPSFVIPTLGEAGLALLTCLLAFQAFRQLRRRPRQMP